MNVRVNPSIADPMRAAAPLLRIDDVKKSFGGVLAVAGVSLDVAGGEFFALLGPSGCGKTTLLRMLAGFEQPDSGRILLGGEDIAGVPPHRRPVNMMFQNYALFPHLSVEDNIAFGLRRAGLPKAEIAARVAEMLALGRLEALARRKPDQLSGGQQQRVALVRALARRPRLLLLDEPLAALDRKLREDTQQELKDVQRRLGMTFIIVTHDQDEAMALADRVGVMNAGRLVQVGSPRELYETPATRWVAGFIGDANLIDGAVARRDDALWTIDAEGVGAIRAAAPARGPATSAVAIMVRPEQVRLARGTESDAGANRFAATVVAATFLGDATHYALQLAGGATIRARVSNAGHGGQSLSAGERVVATIAPDAVVVLEA